VRKESSVKREFPCSRSDLLTVGPAVEREPLYGIELKNILVATAFGTSAERQAAYAFSLAQQHHSRITLLHVQQHPDHEEEIVNQLQALLPAASELHCLPLFRVEWGDPVD
jgi:universal stress protein family protein